MCAAVYWTRVERGGVSPATGAVSVPGAVPGDWVDWGGLLGRAPVMDVRDRRAVGVVERAGHVPPPLRALGN